MTYISKWLCLFSSTATKTIENTTVETSQIPTGRGSTTIKANSLGVWDTIEIRTNVRLSSWNSQSTTFRVKINWVTISSTGTLPNALSQNQADFLFVLRVTWIWVNGTIVADWRTLINWGSWVTTASIRAFPQQAPITVDTTQDFDIDITYQWTNADPANILLVEQCSLHLNKF